MLPCHQRLVPTTISISGGFYSTDKTLSDSELTNIFFPWSTRPREGHPTYAATPRPSLSEGRDGGIFIPPSIARRASLSRHVLVPNLALFSLFHAATATALRKLSIRRRLGGRRTPRRLWNRGLLARHYAGLGVIPIVSRFPTNLTHLFGGESNYVVKYSVRNHIR